jgi:hypothetical protein
MDIRARIKLRKKREVTGCHYEHWDYPSQLTLGTHKLKLIFNGPKNSQASLDGVIVTQTGQ